jgi:hypothetical protein
VSGEAFGSIHLVDALDVAAGRSEVNLDDLRRLADALSEHDAEDAAAFVHAFIGRVDELKAAARHADGLLSGDLRFVIRAFNYWQSGDSPEEQYRSNLATWRAGRG